MVANLITNDKWMVSEQATAPEMVDEILARYKTLDTCRQYMFIKWLQAHSEKLNGEVHDCEDLTVWLESMSHEDIYSEYRFIMDELGWWGNLDEHSLTRIMLADMVGKGA